MTRINFRNFLPALLLFSRLWHLFNTTDNNKTRDLNFWKGKNIEDICDQLSLAGGDAHNLESDKSSLGDNNSSVTYAQFVDYCIKDVITPETYFASGIKAMKDEKIQSFDDSDQEILPHSESLDDSCVHSCDVDIHFTEHDLNSPERNTCPSPHFEGKEVQCSDSSPHLSVATPQVNEDINISLYSPINSVASIVIRSNVPPAENIGGDDCISIDSICDFTQRDVFLGVSPPKPQKISNNLMETSSALCSLYGVSFGGTKQHQSHQNRNRHKAALNSNAKTGENNTHHVRVKKSNVQKECIATYHRPQLGWRDLNRKREIIHHPTMSSPREVYVVDDNESASSQPVTTRSLKTPQSLRNIRSAKSPKRTSHSHSWCRNKESNAPLWKPRHVSKVNKKSFSTIRTMKM
mmetsp:Transcript_13295/g.21767  ORF Transcript_13295/g.21767 Transcript_13295/m.21767 type:complete len:407 (-) Transcript_13295:210-1430(-)